MTASPPLSGSTSAQTRPLACPRCGSAHLVEERAGRYLCLYCNVVSVLAGADSASQRLVAQQQVCANCGAENPREATTCGACERPLASRCLKCEVGMAVWQETCPRCGTEQAAYQAHLEARARQRQQSQRATRARSFGHRRRRGGFWRIGWIIWPLFWLVGTIGREMRETAEALSSGDALPGLLQFGNQSFALAIGTCIVGAGLMLVATASLPSLLRRD